MTKSVSLSPCAMRRSKDSPTPICHWSSQTSTCADCRSRARRRASALSRLLRERNTLSRRGAASTPVPEVAEDAADEICAGAWPLSVARSNPLRICASICGVIGVGCGMDIGTA